MRERELNKIQHDTLARWTIERSRDLYGIRNWGAGYFDIAENGNVVVRSRTSSGEKQEISIIDVIKGAKDRGLDMPVLIRIENLLDSQISLIHKSFYEAIKKFGYKGKYTGVYPIKVNQQQPVVEEIIRFGSQYHHGLEAGSKAELIAAISMFQDTEACLICNGYKDEEFIDLVLYVTKLGYKCFFVIEMFSELKQILKRSKILNITPRLGVRLKLSAKAGGHWASSGGDRSLF
ncbi:MAG: arginine decarboxylase, partial [Chitinispirillia bacterium]